MFIHFPMHIPKLRINPFSQCSIVLEPSDIGSFLMKSMDIEFQGLSGIGSCLRSPKGWCLCDFECIQVVHDLT